MFAGKVDLLLAEGYKGAAVPKIAVVRAAVSDDLPCDPHDLIALVSDVPFALAVPRFSFGQGPQIARFLVDAFSRQGFLLPAWPQLVERHPAS